MRALILDELNHQETAAVREYLAARADFSGVEGLYWLELPPGLWAETQRRAREQGAAGTSCFRLAVELGPDWVRFELLVRSEILANTGGGQATAEQALFVLDWAGAMARELGLVTCADLGPGDPDRGG
ncbi:hypothetical protein FACS189460_3730 [Deltaproteobacteria bacterium]|nr:hypothetical protein FACS189460_3730 [Deltaproteobacteria bacterium]